MSHRRNRIRWIGQRPADQYAALPNELIRDHQLSWQARGIAAYLWSHIDGYEASANGIASESATDPKSIRKYLDELAAHHWIAVRDTGPTSRDYYLHPARRLTEEEYAKAIGDEIPNADLGEIIPDETKVGQKFPKGTGNIPLPLGKNSPSKINKTAGTYGKNSPTKNKENQVEDQVEDQGTINGATEGHKIDAKEETTQPNPSGEPFCSCCNMPPVFCQNAPLVVSRRSNSISDEPPPF